MSWEKDLEQLLRNQMPYAFKVNGAKGVFQEADWACENPDKDPMGPFDYVRDFVEVQRKRAFFEGYACGSSDAAQDNNLEFNKDLSRVGAERAWLKWEKR